MQDTRIMIQKNIKVDGVITAEEVKQEVIKWKEEKRKTGMAFRVKSKIETTFVYGELQYMYVKVFYYDDIHG